MSPRKPTAIVSLSDRPDYIKFLVYSESGSGKTVLCGTTDTPATDGRGLIIGVEDGTVSAKRQGSTADLWPITEDRGWADVQDAYRWLKDNPDHGYDWVSVDSLTELREICLAGLLGEGIAKNSSRDPDIVSLPEYGKVLVRVKKMVNAFVALPVNVAFTAHIDKPEDFDEEEDPDELTHPAMPLIPGKKGQLQQYICGLMHVVGYLGVVPERRETDPDDADKSITIPERRILLCKTTKRYFGKDRFDSLPNGRLRDPTIPELERLIKEAMPNADNDEGEKKASKKEQGTPKARRRAA